VKKGRRITAMQLSEAPRPSNLKGIVYDRSPVIRYPYASMLLDSCDVLNRCFLALSQRQSLCYCLCFVSLGMCVGVLGPSVNNIAAQCDVDVEDIGSP